MDTKKQRKALFNRGCVASSLLTVFAVSLLLSRRWICDGGDVRRRAYLWKVGSAQRQKRLSKIPYDIACRQGIFAYVCGGNFSRLSAQIRRAHRPVKAVERRGAKLPWCIRPYRAIAVACALLSTSILCKYI